MFLSLFKKDTDVFAPARLFILVWSLSIGLVELKFSGLQKVWSAYSWIVVFVNLFSVLLGMFIIYVFNFSKETKSISEIRRTVFEYSIDQKLLFKVIIFLLIAYIISYLTIYIVVGFIPFFTARPDITRTKWNLFGVGLIIHSVPTIMYLILIYFLKVHRNFITKSILAIIFLFTFLSYFFLLQRFDLVIFLVLAAVFLYYGTNKLRGRYVIVFVIGIIIFMYAISTIRASNLFIEYLYYGGKMKFSKDFAVLTEPYMYISMNIENFANAVDKLSTFTYGYYTFDFILALTGLKHWLFEYAYIEKFPFLISDSYNTYTMFFVYYRDFGIMGSFIFPFLIGMIFNSSYQYVRRFPNINSISFYGVFVFVILFSFFIPMLSWLHFVYNLILIFLLTRFLVNRSKSLNTG
ncbi:MAG: oligosaccharide repeat unit polymerase [Ignavibacteriaceae bacterium]|jgi:oligosaccharide repeat unit polymerase|nr:oligosaccharide repeat unit polymerase [Ignavibacteriaceae bacterium]